MLNFDWYLLLFLLVVPLLSLFFGLAQKKNKALRKKLGGFQVFQRLAKSFDPSKTRLKFTLSITGIVLLILALGNLREPGEKTLVQREGVDVLVAMDISRSMWAQDVLPNRSERAKQFAVELVEACRGDRVGVILFAGQAFLQTAFTSDYSAVKNAIRSASPTIDITQGTEIDEVMDLVKRINERDTKKKQRALVFITDGEIHKQTEAEVSLLLDKVAEVKDAGSTPFIIGMGTEKGAPIPIPNKGYQKDENNQPVQSRMNVKLLKKLAGTGGGFFADGTSHSRAVLNKLKNQMSVLDREAFEEEETTKHHSLFYWFAIPAFGVLFLECFVSHRKESLFISFKKKGK